MATISGSGKSKATFDGQTITLEHAGFGPTKSQKDASPVVIPITDVTQIDVGPGFTPTMRVATRRGTPEQNTMVLTTPKKEVAAFVALVNAHITQSPTPPPAPTVEALQPSPVPQVPQAPQRPQRPEAPALKRSVAHRHDASYEGITVSGGKLRKGFKSYPVAECEAQVDHGANIAARITATRVIGGAILAGPVGALIGGLAKKNRQKVYLAVTVPDDLILIELKAKHEMKARTFAAKVNQAAEVHRSQQ